MFIIGFRSYKKKTFISPRRFIGTRYIGKDIKYNIEVAEFVPNKEDAIAFSNENEFMVYTTISMQTLSYMLDKFDVEFFKEEID